MKEKAKNKLSLFIFFLIYLIDYLGVFVVFPILPVVFLKDNFFSINTTLTFVKPFLIGSIIACHALGLFIAGPIFGELSDQYGRKKILYVGIIMGIFGNILNAISFSSASITLLYIARIIIGISSGNAAVLLAATADISTEKNRPHHLGYLTSGAVLGIILGPFIGGHLTQIQFFFLEGYSIPFWFIAILYLLTIVLLPIYKDKYNPSKRKISLFIGFKNIIDSYKDKKLGLIFSIFLLFVISVESFSVSLPIFALEKFAVSAAILGNIISFGGVLSFLGAIFINKFISDKFSSKKILTGAFFVLIFSYLFCFIAKNPKALFISSGLYGLANILCWIHLISLSISSSGEFIRGKILGVSQSIFSFSLLIGSLLIGSITYLHYNFAIWICAAFATSALLIFFMHLKKLPN